MRGVTKAITASLVFVLVGLSAVGKPWSAERIVKDVTYCTCLLYTSPSPRD